MLKIDILTLFPQMFSPLRESIMKRAEEKGLVSFEVTDIRPYADDPRRVDDVLYGGGAGMVMKPEPIINALQGKGYEKGDTVVITTPSGKPFTQLDAEMLAKKEHIFFIAGHYEGIDQRVSDITEALEYSVGDYVLTGGELPAMIMVDSVVRLVDGVLGHSSSLDEESFNEGLLEYPQYTRPPVYEGYAVPDVLQQGNHSDIQRWRRKEALQKTFLNRPDLITKVPLTSEDKKLLSCFEQEKREKTAVYAALVHYPVLDPKNHVIATSVTNLDIHDIARLSATYNVKKYFIIQPGEGQKSLVENLIAYWTTGHGSVMNSDRAEALSKVKVLDTFEDAVSFIENEEGCKPFIAGTSAKNRAHIMSYSELRHKMICDNEPTLLVFGTGHGLADEIMETFDGVLKPIEGRGDYNHLSVRSAVSITLDRLLGER